MSARRKQTAADVRRRAVGNAITAMVADLHAPERMPGDDIAMKITGMPDPVSAWRELKRRGKEQTAAWAKVDARLAREASHKQAAELRGRTFTTARGAVVLSKQEIAICAAEGCTPQTFAELKAQRDKT